MAVWKQLGIIGREQHSVMKQWHSSSTKVWILIIKLYYISMIYVIFLYFIIFAFHVIKQCLAPSCKRILFYLPVLGSCLIPLFCPQRTQILYGNPTNMINHQQTLMVEIRCAMAILVLFSINALRLAWTNYSLAESKALVASSSNKMFEFFRMALAIAILCFWPPDICGNIYEHIYLCSSWTNFSIESGPKIFCLVTSLIILIINDKLECIGTFSCVLDLLHGDPFGVVDDVLLDRSIEQHGFLWDDRKLTSQETKIVI